MNRRSFFKTICGGIAAVYAVFAPSKAMSEVAKLDPSLMGNIDLENALIDFELWQINRRVYPAVIIHENGSIEKVPWQDLYKKT